MNPILYQRLGNPQVGQNFIHVAGTNGKGSTCAMLAEILQCAGYKVGLFTSPHLERYTERIKINGQEISQKDWDRLEKQVNEAAVGLETVEFDRITALGFLKFKEEACDIIVLEVGLGGRLDATNIIENPVLCAIASIGYDHTELLGNTIAEIASEKAGIIKKGSSVVVSYQSSEALDVFKAKALEMKAKLSITDPSMETLHSISLDGQVISYKSHKGLKLSLLGSYQYKNVALVLDCIDELRNSFDIPEAAISEGLSKVVWPGRFEILRKSPLIILDGAHNSNGAEELAECIKAYIPQKRVHFVMGVLSDKDYERMLGIIAPLASKFTLVTPPSHRALSADKLKTIIETKYKIPAEAADSVIDGIKKATLHQDFKEQVVIFGSLYQVAEVRNYFLQEL